MPLSFWCVLFVMFTPFVMAFIAKSGGFDNHNPRDATDLLTGYRRRAYAAQQNSFESFPIFAVAVLAAYALDANQQVVGYLAVSFVVSRILYCVFYLTDTAGLRSLVWLIGLALCVAIFTAPLWG
jgi:uncharacterized MAPEG superfamily protein